MFLDSNRVISKSHRPTDIDLAEGALLLIDKPQDWTSFDVVNKLRHTIRHHLGVKKFKVGHSGTLDPMATGLLLLCVGKYTKLLTSLTAEDKAYSGEILLGATTPSYDAESEVDMHYATDHISEDDIRAAALSFEGGYAQLPPMYSAIKIKGQKLYQLARRGESIELTPRPVKIHQFEIGAVDGDTVSFYCVCGKGTYIRSLAYDLGKALRSGAHLISLRRESIEKYQVKNALSVDEAIAWVRSTET